MNALDCRPSRLSSKSRPLRATCFSALSEAKGIDESMSSVEFSPTKFDDGTNATYGETIRNPSASTEEGENETESNSSSLRFLTNGEVRPVDGEGAKPAYSEGAMSADGEGVKPVDGEKVKPGIMQRFRETYREYGKILIVVHACTSALWLVMFYYAVISGLDIVPLLRWFGAGEAVIHPFTLPGVGSVAMTYLLYKLVSPVRYTFTFGCTQLAARLFRRWGYISPALAENLIPSSPVRNGGLQVESNAEVERERRVSSSSSSAADEEVQENGSKSDGIEKN